MLLPITIPWRRHAAGCYSSTAAKGLELHIADDLVVIHIQIDSHDIAALGVAYGAYAAGILESLLRFWDARK